LRLRELEIKNLRSAVDTGKIPLKCLFALVGENNAGKSNILKSIKTFLSGGSGGIRITDFTDQSLPIVIKGKFHNFNKDESKKWKKYLVKNELILEKRIWIEEADTLLGQRIKAEYHGYEADPKDWFLSIKMITEKEGNRPKWLEIAQQNNLPEYFFPNGKSNKITYIRALEKYLSENDVEYSEPDISKTQALGLQSNVVASLPSYYLLPAITDYSDEVSKNQTSSTFRRLMGELSERILKNDPRYTEIEKSLNRVNLLLNNIESTDTDQRLNTLSDIEQQISMILQRLMPSVNSVSLSVQISEVKKLFSKGVSLSVDDGVDTDVLAKGHGLQRCVVFSLLKTLIDTEKLSKDKENTEIKSIILGIEEPELYIHPQLSKLFFDVMRDFSKTDQVIYTTHSPIFIDVYEYNSIGIVSKSSVMEGTKIKTSNGNGFEKLDDAKVFKGLTRFNSFVSEMFFAKRILVVEGVEDMIAVNSVLVNEGKIKNRTEEIGWTILVAGGKNSIPFLQRVMNEFDIPYSVLHDSDIKENMKEDDKNTKRKTNSLILELAKGQPVHKFSVNLEHSLGLDKHLKDQFEAHKFFEDPSNITGEVKSIILKVFN